MKNVWIAALCGGVLLGMAAPLSFAHGGEDHSHAQETTAPLLSPTSGGVRWELQSPDVELLGIINDGKLTLYVDHFATNEPLANASVELESKGQTLKLQTDANGMVQADAGWLAKPAHYELMATVQAKVVNDLLVGKIDTVPDNVPTAAGDKPTRLSDGSVFVPKAAQHLLGIRTVAGKTQNVAQNVALNAIVVTDPNASARIQPTQSGRLFAPKAGFPVLGSRVTKGQVLALLEPATSNVDKGDQQDKIAELRSQLTLAEKNAARMDQVAGVVPQMDVDAAHNTVDTLKARLQALQNSLAQQPETLVAPLSGIISSSNVTLGQQANAGDVLFEILDPARLQIEALAYDPALAAQITGATMLMNGKVVELQFVGSSAQLRNQALPLRFALKNADVVMAIGQPLAIHAQTKQSAQGVVLPAASVVNNSEQQAVVWTHTKAERFQAFVVKAQAVDADKVVITEGLPAGAVRAVTQGAALLSQVR
ncbi:MAG: hypothetical protein RI964_1632 [Pseudomonadota bacterium]|jgi:multidrug resistance efflux pump